MITSFKTSKVVFTTAFIVRLVMFSFPSVVNTLMECVELSTPITSFKRLTEGVYLYNHKVAPYDGGVFHQPPLLLCLFSCIDYLPSGSIPILYSTLDLIIAYALTCITQLKQQYYDIKNGQLKAEKLHRKHISPNTVAAMYLFNPLTLLSCASKSTQIFSNLAVAMALLSALKYKTGQQITEKNSINVYSSLSMFWIAFASYLSVYPIMLLPALLLIMETSKPVLHFSGWTVCLFLLSRLFVGTWDFIKATYGIIIFVFDLTPNVGMFWYFFIEIFDQFRSFFMVVFQFHTFIFTAPICIKMRNQPILAATVLCSITAIFKSYPSASDACFYLALVSVHDELFKYCRYGFLVCNLFLYASVLAPIFWHLWIYAGSGNANFFYAITLVYNLGQVILLIDVVYAALRRQFDLNHPEAIGKIVIHK
ncbi:GPI transamidase subunit PIG-U [Mycotypha africana]|uniref:GPI transamidase subunit PIG-U n=1 Tax=Mycotypha africana TaxID=64632 RepID=UPI002301D263|nr:GPI transamidase subunit PIG-U [Mycotypha africana]KAI8987491.1 GPI transamidase subunit PIG-U [Mycotypha africana]